MLNMSVGRDGIGVALLGDRLFAVGGYDGQQYLTVVEAYDPVNNEWQAVSIAPIFARALAWLRETQDGAARRQCGRHIPAIFFVAAPSGGGRPN